MTREKIEEIRDELRAAYLELLKTTEEEGYESLKVTKLCRQIDLCLVEIRSA